MHVTFVLGMMALALLMGTAGSADMRHQVQVSIDNDGVQFDASLDSRRHGYEHAYHDGADRGRFDREHGIPYNLNAKVYRDSARGSERFMGNKEQYQQGYRDGYKAGYDSAYRGVADQYGRIDGRSNENRSEWQHPTDPYAPADGVPRRWRSNSDT
jgi:hypothetical protein